MRYIFVDEAGTSANEPVTVVVGLTANADEHVLSAESLAYEVLGAVPEQYRDEFIFHATQVYGDPKYQGDNWPLTDRLELLQHMMGIPKKIGMAITVAAQWRGATDHLEGLRKHLPLSAPQADHFMAFLDCIAVTDRNIRKHAGPREVASVVAEDVPEMRQFLKPIPHILRANPSVIPQSFHRKTLSDDEAGYNTQKGDFRVTRIRNSIHFVEKAEDPLVQVADACAYGFRRYFAKEKFGLEFVRAILGDENLLRDFAPPCGCVCVWLKPADAPRPSEGL